MAEVKFCGLTRAEDAREAATLGARYVGVIFAGGPRNLDESRARDVLGAAGPWALRVGIFGAREPEDIARMARTAGIQVAQLHSDPDSRAVEALRRVFDGRIWAVMRVSGGNLPPYAAELFECADGVVVDSRVDGKLGGTGVAVDWESAARRLDAVRRRGSALLILAGGLRPANVGAAARIIEPDVVDVSSGVESAPGVKDHAMMRRFVDALVIGEAA